MSRKRKRRVKTTDGNLDVDARAGGVQAPHAVAVGAVVSAPCTGNQKIKTEIGTVTGDKTGLLIGAFVRGCTEDDRD
jgi:hypothetical protein